MHFMSQQVQLRVVVQLKHCLAAAFAMCNHGERAWQRKDGASGPWSYFIDLDAINKTMQRDWQYLAEK